MHWIFHPIRRHRRPQRRGVAIIVVLGLISIAMALSYTMMRAQGTTLKIQQNSSRRFDARQAALSGLMAGLGHLHQADWTGVGSTLAGNLSASESYTVAYSPGDARLTSSHPEYAQWPYRLTLLVTGYATAADGGATSTHKIRAVARLVPKGLSAAPPDWSHMQQFTVYQWSADDFSVEVPSRIQGPVWMQGQLFLGEAYPSTGSSRRRYLSDLNAMRQAGRPDYRPFSGPVHWRSVQSNPTADLLTQHLGVSTQTVSQKTAADWNHPGAAEAYRLYAGGETYDIPRLEQALENVSLAGDPKTNPLGIFLREGSLELRGNVSITGQVISTGDLFITGQNVRLESPSLPSTSASGEPVRLPAAVVGDDFRIFSGAAATVTGSVLAWDETSLPGGTETTQFELNGRLVCKAFAIGPRSEWNYGSSTWGTLHDIFIWQLNNSQPHYDYFPEFLGAIGRKPAPLIRLVPDATPRIDHFPRPGEPVYAPGAGDAGLRWELLDWRDEG
jgi:hypothetical protein